MPRSLRLLIETVMAESIDWFDRYVKNAKPRSKTASTPAARTGG
jgi:hypothetical protein